MCRHQTRPPTRLFLGLRGHHLVRGEGVWSVRVPVQRWWCLDVRSVVEVGPEFHELYRGLSCLNANKMAASSARVVEVVGSPTLTDLGG